MSWGNRKAERVHMEHRYEVNLMGVDGTWRRKCALVDVSAGEFFLLLSSTGLAFRRCELVRVDGTTVGVRFVAEKKKRKGAVGVR